jgi:hypothetical protein
MQKVVIPLAILFLSITGIAQAQTASIDPKDITGIITIVTNPEIPLPYQQVTASLEASGLTLNASLITWKVDGSTVKSGRGEKSITFGTGPIGSRSNVSVIIESPQGTFSKSTTISPSEIDFLWQGETYIPPFFEGRALWSNQTTLILMAIPHVGATGGGELNPSNLNYKWKLNGKVLGSQSGKGVNSLSITDSVLSIPQTVKLEVYSDQGILLASSSITLQPSKPSLLVYEKNPLYGISFHKEVGTNYLMREKEVSFITFPYFFSIERGLESFLQYLWRTNTGITDTSNTVTYRAPEEGGGSSQVTVKTSNPAKLLQVGQKNFVVQFGDKK